MAMDASILGMSREENSGFADSLTFTSRIERIYFAPRLINHFAPSSFERWFSELLIKFHTHVSCRWIWAKILRGTWFRLLMATPNEYMDLQSRWHCADLGCHIQAIRLTQLRTALTMVVHEDRHWQILSYWYYIRHELHTVVVTFHCMLIDLSLVTRSTI